MNNFFIWITSWTPTILCSNSKWQYIFFGKISKRYFIVKKKKLLWPLHVWENWYPWLIEAIVSILMEVLRWSRTISHLFLRICCIVDDIVHFIWMRGYINNYPHPVCGIDRYQFKKNTSLYDRLVFNTLYPPLNKFFLSVTKFSLYISPYILTFYSAWSK